MLLFVDSATKMARSICKPISAQVISLAYSLDSYWIGARSAFEREVSK